MKVVLITHYVTFSLPLALWDITSLTKDRSEHMVLKYQVLTTESPGNSNTSGMYVRKVHQTIIHRKMILLYNCHLGKITCTHLYTLNTQHLWGVEYVFSLHSAICNLASNGLANLLFILVHMSTVNMAEPNLDSEFGDFQIFPLSRLHKQQGRSWIATWSRDC